MDEQRQREPSGTPESTLVGRSVERLEDDAILAGQSTFLDDVERPEMLHAKVCRSPHAHARVETVDTSGALELDGVVDAVTGEEVAEIAGDFGQRRSGLSRAEHPPLVRDRARMQGDGVAAVAAETPYLAGDALERIEVSYDPLPAVTDLDAALGADEPARYVHPGLDAEDDDVDGNAWGSYSLQVGDADAAFERADHVVGQTIETPRPTAVPMEPHGVVAEYSPGADELTLVTTTQEAHQICRDLSEVLEMPYNRITVKQPANMGGGFGHKLGLKAHEVVAAALSIRTERPVKLSLSRMEEFQATRSRQPQRHELELALAADGEFLGLRGEVTAQGGAYAAETRPGLVIAMMFLPTPYRIAAVDLSGLCVFTNTVPAGPYRGFGLTQATTARETLIDRAATEVGLDPWELRRRNVITDDECPTEHPAGMYLDSCGVEECLDLVDAGIDESLLQESTPAHVTRGLGVATAMHVSSLRRPTYDADNSAVALQLHEDGTVSVQSDQCPMGTGIRTTLAQIVAEELGLDYRDLSFEFGDSRRTPHGLGTWGSRGITIAGSAAQRAAASLRERLLAIAAYQLDVPRSRLSLVEGAAVDERGGASVSIASLAYDAHYVADALPPEVGVGPLVVTETFDSPADGFREDGTIDPSTTYPTNAHAAVVEVDTRTGACEILDYAIGDDVGRVINPMIVEGQVQGGTVQGLGMALGEHLEYDAAGQLRNGTMEEYSLPLIGETPMLTTIEHADTVAERAPNGAKGVGESGAITAPVTIANAVNDALLGEYVEEPVIDLPLTPDLLSDRIDSAF